MPKSQKELLSELETQYKAQKKDLVKKVRVEEAKELSGLFDQTLAQAVGSLRDSISQGLGVYHRNLKSVVVRIAVDGKGVTSLKNTIRTIRMTPKEIEAWDTAHPELSREDVAQERQVSIDAANVALAEYNDETARLVDALESEAQEPETQEPAAA